MGSFRNNIIEQVMTIPAGKIFTFHDLKFEMEKAPLVISYLSNLIKEKKLKRFERGAYYRPKISAFGLGLLSISEEDKLEYLTRKHDGYITGADIYNRLGLTEQVAMNITLATPNNVRNFKIGNFKVNCVKSYSDAYKNKETLYLVWILDAIKDIKHIPETTEQKVYDKLKYLHLKNMNRSDICKLVEIAQSYPPRVRKILADMLEDFNMVDMVSILKKNILPTTKFNFKYKRKMEYIN